MIEQGVQEEKGFNQVSICMQAHSNRAPDGFPPAESLWTLYCRMQLHQISCELKHYGTAEATNPGSSMKATSHIDSEHNAQPKTQQSQQTLVKTIREPELTFT